MQVLVAALFHVRLNARFLVTLSLCRSKVKAIVKSGGEGWGGGCHVTAEQCMPLTLTHSTQILISPSSKVRLHRHGWKWLPVRNPEWQCPRDPTQVHRGPAQEARPWWTVSPTFRSLAHGETPQLRAQGESTLRAYIRARGRGRLLECL